MTVTPLDTLRVLDFSQGMAGALVTMILSDAGANVVKVEPPTGDSFRALPAARQWHRGKRSVTINLADAKGQAEVQRLITEADLVVESFRPGKLEDWGLGPEGFITDHSSLIWCSITGYGRSGPLARYPAWEGTVAAKSGRYMQLAGILPRQGPIYGAVPVASYGAAMMALQGILAALLARAKTGLGQRVETSLLQGLTAQDLGNWLKVQLIPPEERSKALNPRATDSIYKSVYLAARTADGKWIQFGNTGAHLFLACMQALDLEELYTDPRFAGAPFFPREEEQNGLQEMMLKRVREKTLDEWMAILSANPNVGAEPLLSTEQGMDHPQVLHNGHVIEVDDPLVGPMRQIGTLARLSETPMSVRGPAPIPGSHTSEVLEASEPWGVIPRELASTPASPQGEAIVASDSAGLPRHALSGLLVLDFASWLAGSMASLPLADLGARVIKIEPLEGDPYRLAGTGEGVAKTSAGKEGLALNLKDPEVRAIVRSLIQQADMLIHNFRPGVAERLELGYEHVHALNSRCVYVYATSYGHDGASAYRPMFHPIAGAIAGNALYQAGRGVMPPEDADLPFDDLREASRQLGRCNEPNPDPNAAMATAVAALLALVARERMGRGQYVETTMICSNAYACSDDFLRYEGKPPRPLPDAGMFGLSALYRLYMAQNSWVFLAAHREEDWSALCTVISDARLAADPRFATAQDRHRHDAALAEALSTLLAQRAADEWERDLLAAGVACVRADGPSLSEFLIFDPHCEAASLVVDTDRPHAGLARVVGMPLWPPCPAPQDGLGQGAS